MAAIPRRRSRGGYGREVLQLLSPRTNAVLRPRCCRPALPSAVLFDHIKISADDSNKGMMNSNSNQHVSFLSFANSGTAANGFSASSRLGFPLFESSRPVPHRPEEKRTGDFAGGAALPICGRQSSPNLNRLRLQLPALPCLPTQQFPLSSSSSSSSSSSLRLSSSTFTTAAAAAAAPVEGGGSSNDEKTSSSPSAGAAATPATTAPPTSSNVGITVQSAKEKIEELVKKKPAVLFMKGSPDAPQCGFSAQTVNALQTAGLEDFTFVNVLRHDAIREGVKASTGWPTLPQVFLDGEFIGGCDVVLELLRTGELKAMVDELKRKESEKKAMATTGGSVSDDVGAAAEGSAATANAEKTASPS